MRGHPVLGLVAGLLFGVFLAITLVLANVVPLNSVLVTAMPVLGILYGLVMAGWAPFGRKKNSTAG